jgi:RNA-directed DNA polymerase
MGETLGSPTVSMKLQRIAQQAQRYPAMVFNNVFHLIDRDFLREAYRLTRKNSAPGVDQVTATQYAEHLEDNLRDLHERLRDNRYVAPPVERVWIEKEGGKKRPIGKPCFEDKIVQRAVVMILEAIFEQDFHAFSHGFRKGHSPHQALHELREQCRTLHINWRVDADVSGFFGKFHGPRKVDNSFLGRASAYRHRSLGSSLDLRLWFTRLSHGVRPFPTAHRAKSFLSLFR